jgi:hypothetical protein
MPQLSVNSVSIFVTDVFGEKAASTIEIPSFATGRPTIRDRPE